MECGYSPVKEGIFKRIRLLKEGDYFGEIALIQKVRRTMSVRSVGNSVTLCLERDGWGVDFKGNKNQVAFFERELSGAEVAAIYNAGIPNDISSLNPTRLFSLSEISSDPDVTYGGATLSSDVPDDPFEYWS